MKGERTGNVEREFLFGQISGIHYITDNINTGYPVSRGNLS